MTSSSTLYPLIGTAVAAAVVVILALTWAAWAATKQLERIREADAAWDAAPGGGAVYLSIVVPAYNEEDRLPLQLRETIAYLTRRAASAKPSFTWEVVVVDDGSRDGTADVVREMAAGHAGVPHDGEGRVNCLRLVQQPSNGGKGSAVRSGVCGARGDLVLMADADGATRISDLERLERALLADGAAAARTAGAGSAGGVGGVGGTLGVAVGSRAHLQSDAAAERTWYRTLLMHGFHALVFAVVGNRIKDTQCGFKLFTRRSARLLFRNLRLRRWCFDVELISLALTLGIPLREVSVNWTEVPGSKLRPLSVLHMAWELLLILAGYKIFGTWRVVVLPS